jgi:hypothetical protein
MNLTSKRLMMLTLSIGTLFVSSRTRAADCPVGHCSQYATTVGTICDQLVSATGKPKASFSAPYIGPSGLACTCPCSCFIEGTAIESSSGNMRVETIEKNMTLPTQGGYVKVAAPLASEVKNHPVVELELSNGRSLFVTNNHPMITPGGFIKSAGSLTKKDKLLNSKGEKVQIANIKNRKYSGFLYNFSMAAKEASGADRVIVAEGVQTGDWTVQSRHDRLKQNVTLRQVMASRVAKKK